MTTSLATSVATSSVLKNSTSTTPIASVFSADSPLAALLWFETIAACFTYGLGFIGNLLSLSIFCSMKEFRNVSTGLLFIFMTLSNTIHLWTLTTEFLSIYSVYIYANGFVQCQLNYYIQNVSRAVSTYLAVTVTLDRFVRSELPMRSKMICTQRNAIKLAITYVIICCALWSFFFLPYFIQNLKTGSCSSAHFPAFYFFLSYIHAPVRAVLVCFIPVVIMAVANLRMLSNIRHSRRRVAATATIFNTASVVGTAAVVSNVSGATRRRMKALDRMLFYMMLANVGTFIITQIPFHIYSVAQANLTNVDSYTKLLIRGLLLIWSSIYFGVAFYFYCLASPLFRGKFITTLKNLIHFILPYQRA